MRSGLPPKAPELPSELGPFKIQEVLGEGGSAVVYAAERDGQAVALKVPREGPELTEKERRRFLEEAKMLQRVRHRSVVEVLDAGRLPDGQPYLLMRRYEGETLAAHLKKGGALSLERALDLFEQLAAATTALHDAGLLHRDLKPENVFLIDSGRTAKLLDFGIAKDRDAPASTTTQAGVARGTPATMAPERFFGAPATIVSDVYELAVLLYAMLVGRLPWTDVTNVDARLNPLPPADAGAAIPEALSTVIMRALSTRPERRPASVRAFASEVSEANRNGEAAARVTADARVSDRPPPAELAGVMASPGETAVALEQDTTEPSRRGRELQEVPAPLPKRRQRWGPWVTAGALLGGLGVGLIVTQTLRASAGDEPIGDETAAATATQEQDEQSPNQPVIPPLDTAPAAALSIPLPAAESAPTKPTPENGSELSPGAAPRPASAKVPRRSRSAEAPIATTGTKGGPAVVSAGSQPSAAPTKKAPPSGKPRGAPCTRSAECASMLCAADTCQ